MSEKKLYTAFVSSAYKSLREERNTVINCLLDFRIVPICMEHFTVHKFSNIETFINESDFFVVLLGGVYGSCDEEGIAWTEREYDYAVKKKLPVLAIASCEYKKLKEKDEASLTEDEKKQLAFGKKIGFLCEVDEDKTIESIVTKFFGPYDYTEALGWTRRKEENLSAEELDEWKREHMAYDIGGTWYHVHLSEDDEKYIRIGSITIDQEFSPQNYKKLFFRGKNYNAKYYDAQSGKLVEDKMKYTEFSGDYTLEENGTIFGIFKATRRYSDEFRGQNVDKGVRRGIHDFQIDELSSTKTLYMEGEFHDEAPSPKMGRIFLFREENTELGADQTYKEVNPGANKRNEFLLDLRGEYIEQR